MKKGETMERIRSKVTIVERKERNIMVKGTRVFDGKQKFSILGPASYRIKQRSNKFPWKLNASP